MKLARSKTNDPEGEPGLAVHVPGWNPEPGYLELPEPCTGNHSAVPAFCKVGVACKPKHVAWMMRAIKENTTESP